MKWMLLILVFAACGGESRVADDRTTQEDAGVRLMPHPCGVAITNDGTFFGPIPVYCDPGNTCECLSSVDQFGNCRSQWVCVEP